MLADRYTVGRLANQSAAASNGSGTPSKLPGAPLGRVHGLVGLAQRGVRGLTGRGESIKPAHGLVGLAQRGVRGLTGRGEIAADADWYRDQVPVDEMRLAQRRADPADQTV